MVTKYGFSEKLGPVCYSSGEEVFLGKDFSTRQNYSEEVASEIDEEIRKIIEDAFEECEKILSTHSDKLELVAQALLEVETLDGEQFKAIYDGEKTADDLAADIEVREEMIRRENEKEAAESKKIMKQEVAAERMAEREIENIGPLSGEFGNPFAANGEDDPKGSGKNDGASAGAGENPAGSAETGGSETDGAGTDSADTEDVSEEEEDLSIYDTDYLNADDDEEENQADKKDDSRNDRD
jgi:cell division protease FtsH